MTRYMVRNRASKDWVGKDQVGNKDWVGEDHVHDKDQVDYVRVHGEDRVDKDRVGNNRADGPVRRGPGW